MVWNYWLVLIEPDWIYCNYGLCILRIKEVIIKLNRYFFPVKIITLVKSTLKIISDLFSTYWHKKINQ